MSACSRDRNTGSSAGAALRITRSYLRIIRNINSARRIAGCQPERQHAPGRRRPAPPAVRSHSLAVPEDRTAHVLPARRGSAQRLASASATDRNKRVNSPASKSAQVAASERGEFGDAVVAGGVYAAQLGLLLGGELGLASPQPSVGSRHGHALAGAEPEEVDLEFGEGGEDVEEHFAHGSVGSWTCPPRESLMPRAAMSAPIARASGTDRASRSSFGTTGVSPPQTAAGYWSSPGRVRVVRGGVWCSQS